MDLKVTSTGKRFYRLDPGICALLLEAFPASFERIDVVAPGIKPSETVEQWSIARTVTGRICIQHITRLRASVPFCGDPDHAEATYASIGAHVPAHIIEKYRATLAAENPDAREAAHERAEQERQRLEAAMAKNRAANPYGGGQ